jgi:hypothetical protein
MPIMRNLLAETVETLQGGGKRAADVAFVGTSCGSLTWAQFAEHAKGVDYDSSYGSVYISMELVVVGDGWWLERFEYDGCEHWSFKSLPNPPTEPVPDDRIAASIMERFG